MSTKPRLKEKYLDEVIPELMKEFGIANKMAVPGITKIVVNSGVGDAAKNKDILTKMQADMAVICGQAPSVRKARLSVASFSIRDGMPIGLTTTLRGDRMWIFLDKLISITLPRLRDFRGISKTSFDKNGNYSLGIKDHTLFPEIDITKANPRGLEVTIVTNNDDVEISRKLLTLLGMPFEKEEEE